MFRCTFGATDENANRAVQRKKCSTIKQRKSRETMALERRGNGLYFYKKERRGSRVVSIYSGGGSLAQCFHILDQADREEARLEKESKKKSFEAEKQRHDEIDQVIESFCNEAEAFEDALFLVNGYHVHQRQWRKTRNDKNDEGEEA